MYEIRIIISKILRSFVVTPCCFVVVSHVVTILDDVNEVDDVISGWFSVEDESALVLSVILWFVDKTVVSRGVEEKDAEDDMVSDDTWIVVETSAVVGEADVDDFVVVKLALIVVPIVLLLFRAGLLRFPLVSTETNVVEIKFTVDSFKAD